MSPLRPARSSRKSLSTRRTQHHTPEITIVVAQARLGKLTLLGLLWLHPVAAQPLTPMAQEHVFDQAQALPEADRSALEEKLRVYATKAPGRIRVSLQPSLPTGQSVEACALQLFQAHQGQPSDVVLLLTMQDRHLTLQMGSRWTGWDQRCQQLLDNKMVPALRRNDLKGGLHSTVDEVQQWLLHPTKTEPAPKGPVTDTWLDHVGVDKLVYLGVACWSVFLICCKLLAGDRGLVTVLIFSGPGLFGALMAAGIAHILWRSQTIAFGAAIIGFLGAGAALYAFLAALGLLATKLGFGPDGPAWAKLKKAPPGSNYRNEKSKHRPSSSTSVTSAGSSSSGPPSNSGGFGSGASSTW